MMLPRPQPQMLPGQYQQPSLPQPQQPQPPMLEAGPGGQNPLLDAMRARAMSDQLAGTTKNIKAVDPWSALAQTLSGGLEGWAKGNAVDKENAETEATAKSFADILNGGGDLKSVAKSALASANPKLREFGMKATLESLSQKPQAAWTDVDTNGDGTPDAQRSSTGEYKPVDQPLSYDQRLKIAQGSAANTTINMGGEREFDKTVGAEQGKAFAEMWKDGTQANADLGQIADLRGNLATAPGGVVGGLQALASDWGVKLGPNASSVEAANAVISRLVPRQRPPGSGSSSDLDVKMFRQSLPQLMNTPGGNQLILDTMQGMAEYRANLAKIAGAAMTGQMGRAEATQAMLSLPDPMAAYRAWRKGSTGGPKVPLNNKDARKPREYNYNPATNQVE